MTTRQRPDFSAARAVLQRHVGGQLLFTTQADMLVVRGVASNVSGAGPSRLAQHQLLDPER